MIKFRIDVDYPYPSRAKSFLYIALRIKRRKSEDYLKNARIIATIINDSSKQVIAYWFFTPYTIPDKQLLDLLKADRHEVALHIATDPYKELKILENETHRKVRYYTIHGTERVIAQLLWGRKLGEKQARVPSEFPLRSFHDDFTNRSMDSQVYNESFDEAKKQVEEWISQDAVLTIHPEWLLKTNSRGRRGPYYELLRALLEVDKEFDSIIVRKRGIAKIAYNVNEYEKSIIPTAEFLNKLAERRSVDLFTFIERKWCCPIPNPSVGWVKSEDNIGLLEIKDYATWWNIVGKKTRNLVRKAEKSEIKVNVVESNEAFIEGVWKIYNETPIRQGRAFPHYGQSLESVAWNIHRFEKSSTFIGAFLQDELVGFIQILYGDSIAIISQILSLQKHWDKAVNNAVLAKAVEVCASNGNRWVMYGRMGNHPSLDRFKESNGFVKFPVTRYYVPLTGRGRVAVRLGVHREFKDTLPKSFISVFNWLSRVRTRLKS